MSLVGISNKRTRRGIRSPGFAGETWDWRDPAGSTGNTGRARAGYRVMTVIDALSTASDLGAYMVPYSLVDPDGNALGTQPRVSVDALPWLRGLGFALRASCLFVDVDNPNRRPWTTEDRERAHVEHALIPMLATVGVCATPYGRRLIQPLDRALDVETFARVARSFALALDLAGVIGVDHRCADWTRHYRLSSGPRMALRDEPGWLDLSRMTPIAPPTPVAAIPRRQKAPRGTIGYVAPVEPTWSTAVAHRYRPMVADLADAVAAFTGDARALLRAVGGALCERGVPVEHVPRLVEGVSIEGLRSARGDTAFDDALRTVRRWQENMGFPGLRALRALHPDLADLVRRHTPSASEQCLFAQIAAARLDAPSPSSVAHAEVGIERTIGGARGVEAVEVGGCIETHEAARRVALKRAREALSGAKTGGSSTTISCATPAAATEQTEALRREGASVLRVFSPLTVLRADGSPECRFHEAGEVLEAAGMVVASELCGGPESPRCAHWETCDARGRTDADEGARIVVGDHRAIAARRGEVTNGELLVIDEPTDPVMVVRVSAAEVDACIGHAGDFQPRRWALTSPLLFAARAALSAASTTRIDGVRSIEALCAIGWREVPDGVVRAALTAAGDTAPMDGTDTMARVFVGLRRALSEDARAGAAVLRPEAIGAARDPRDAVRLARAASLVHALGEAASKDPPDSVRLTDFNGRRQLTLARFAPELVAALRRTAPTVLLATNVALPHALAEEVSRASVPRHRFASPDVAPSRREVWIEPRARRTHWLKKGAGRWPDWDKGLLRAVEGIVAYVAEHPARRVGIITVPSVAVALRVALGEAPPAGMPASEVELARRLVSPVFARAVDVRWTIGDYGDLASLPPMTGHGGLFTLMDPIPDLGLARHAAACFRATGARESYVEAVTSATLGRAHGLAQHAHRFGPFWSVHIGVTLPAAYGWDLPRTVVGRIPQARRRATMSVDELKAIKGARTIRALARATGLKENTLTRYLNGSRMVPIDIAEVLRSQRVASGQGDGRAGWSAI